MSTPISGKPFRRQIPFHNVVKGDMLFGQKPVEGMHVSQMFNIQEMDLVKAMHQPDLRARLIPFVEFDVLSEKRLILLPKLGIRVPTYQDAAPGRRSLRENDLRNVSPRE